MTADPVPTVPDDSVTASNLVRQFGRWQRRALRAPVYVLHHGRPQFVLASIEFMQALSGARPQPPGDDIADLFDALPDPVLICDAAGVVTTAGRAARLHFGKGMRPGAMLAAILPPGPAALLTATIARAAADGVAGQITLPDVADRGELDLTVAPSTAGIVLAGRPRRNTNATEADAALTAAICALPGHATATISLRGLIQAPVDALAALTGASPDRLHGAAFVDLFAQPFRASVGAALDRAFAGQLPPATPAELLIAGAAARPVSVAFAMVGTVGADGTARAIIAPR